MLASTKVMDTLKLIGLNLYERRLWVALLARGTSTAGELSEIANVPRSRTYDVLQTLADKGFVVVQTAKPIRFVAVAPEEALERAKKRLEEDFRLNIERIDEVKKSPIIKELNEIYQKGLKIITEEDMTGALKGKVLVHQQMGAMFKDANKKISIVTTPEGLNELLSQHLATLRKAKERGVNIKIAITDMKGCSDAIKAFGGIADIRAINSKETPIGGRFVVVDGSQLVVSLTDTKIHSTQDLALWSKSEHAATNVLEPLFNLVWKDSKPLS